MLPNRNSNRVCHDSVNYRYVVSEARPDEDGHVALTINVQSGNNGAILRVTGLSTQRVPVMQSRCYTGRQVVDPVLPRHVAVLISRGIATGWCPKESGAPVVIEVTNAETFGSQAHDAPQNNR